MDHRHQDLPGNPPHFDPSRHIIIERQHYSFSKSMQGGVTPVQVHALLAKHLKDHPERLKYAMADIIYDIVFESPYK